jgi:hypothetical protein
LQTNAEILSDCFWENIEEIVPILINAAQAIAGNDALVMSKQLQDVLAGRGMRGGDA